MTTDQFTYWLQGYVEITNGAQPDTIQWAIIKDHLKTVFVKETPNRYDPTLPQPFRSYCGDTPEDYTGQNLRFVATRTC